MRTFLALALALLSTQPLLADSRDEARQLLEQSGVKGGFVVQLGVGDGQKIGSA